MSNTEKKRTSRYYYSVPEETSGSIRILTSSVKFYRYGIVVNKSMKLTETFNHYSALI